MQRRYRSGRDVSRALSIEELRAIARRRLPAFCLEYLEGGAEDERSLANNRSDFDRYRFVPRTLRDVTERDLSVTLFGRRRALPFLIGPTGFNGMLSHDGDAHLAAAAEAAGIPFTLSNVATVPMERIAERSNGAHWMQVYFYRGRDFMAEIAERAKHAGFEALVVTTDIPVYGGREWDARHFRTPTKLTMRSALDAACHPRWVWDVMVSNGLPHFGNLGSLLPEGHTSVKGGSAFIARQLNPSLNWDDVAWLRDLWKGPLILKGILHPEDAAQAARVGADGIVVSNHGGRQLDGAMSALEALPAIRGEVKDRLHVFMDGGIRRGSDILKAYLLGADAVWLGRATAYGLAAGGAEGARKAISILTQEVDRCLAFLGCRSVGDLEPGLLRSLHSFPERQTL